MIHYVTSTTATSACFFSSMHVQPFYVSTRTGSSRPDGRGFFEARTAELFDDACPCKDERRR